MDNELIKIVSKNGKQLVSAKELYLGLGLNISNWSKWCKNNIVENDFFSENVDYSSFVTGTSGDKSVGYIITLEMAKHLAMMARTEKSHEYRNYFIKCENKLKENQPKLPKTYKEALKELLSQVEENEKLQLENQEMKPKAEFYDTVTESNETFDMSKIAKIINVKGIGRNKLFQILRDKKILCKDNTPYQEYVDRGYFKLVEVTKGAMILHKTVVFQKGLDYIRKLIIQNN